MSVPCRLRWQFLGALAAGVLFAAPALAQTHLDNPFSGSPKWYVNPDYTANANNMAAQESDATIAARMRLVGGQNTAVWMDKIAAVPSLQTHLDNAVTQGANLFLGVVYDLPGRDCHALASNGELPNSAAGLARYKTEYIDAIAAIASQSKYSNIRIVFVVEPDSLPNLVTNMDDPDCAQAAAAVSGAPDGVYIEGIRYAVNKLHAIPNVYLYIDAGHSGWLGWTDKNFPGWIDMMGKVATGFTAGKNAIEGFADDTANTLPTKEPYLSPGMTIGGQDIKSSKFLDWNPYPDEQSFSAEMYRRFVAAGWPSSIGIVHDTSRNGWGGSARPTAASTSTNVDTYVNASKVDRRAHRGLWCNPLGAGIGALPQGNPADWPNSHFDAYVWVKPPGESDGSSKLITDPVLNPDGKGFDQMCDPTYMTSYGVLTGATPDAPVSGAFFPAQFRTLVQNIFPTPGGPVQCQSLPNAPTNVAVAQVSGSELRVSWTSPTAPNNCTVTYNIHAGKTYGFTPSSSTLAASNVTSPYTVTGLTPNTTYYIVVQAVDSLGSVNAPQVQQNTTNGYSLTVTKTGNGASSGTVSGGGINCGTQCSVVTNPSVTVTLTATPPTGGSFTGWSGDCTGTNLTCTVLMSTSRSVSAGFTTTGNNYTLTVNKSGTGTGSVAATGLTCGTTSCTGTYTSGSNVTLTATPDSGSTFTGWSAPCSGSTGACVVTMTTNQTVTATFGGGGNNNTLSVATSGNGSVTSTPSGINCGTTCQASFSSTTTVTLTAQAGSGATFQSWSGCTALGANTCTVSMSQARSVTATFSGTVINNTLTVATSGSGSVTSSPSGISCGSICQASFPSTTTVTLTALPASGGSLQSWSGCTTTNGNTCTVSMSQARSVTATFSGGSTTPCTNPITFTGNTNNFNTQGPVCYRTSAKINGWGCYNMDGRTVSVGGKTVTCGALPLTASSDGYTYFAVTAGTYPWAGIYTY